MGSKTKREVIHLPASSTKETVSYVLGRHIKNQKPADILGPRLTMPKTRNGKQGVHRLSHRVAFNVLWIQSILCRLGRFLVWGLHASQPSGAGHSGFSILQSPTSASQLWLGILSSPFSECCAPGFVQLSRPCHSGLISNVSFPSIVFTSAHLQVPVHCSKSPLPSTSPPSHAEHWVPWPCLIFLRCPFQGMSWFLAHCRGRDLFPPWTCQTPGPVRPMAMLPRTDRNSANSEA